MDDIFSILDVLDRPGGKVLATIIDVEGSAYKKEGSSMVFFEDGSRIGMLSAGCLEKDLSLKAEEVLRKGTISIVQYDMSEETDLSWGQGAGCNGTITILLETVDERLESDLLKVKKLLQANNSVMVYKKIGELGEYLFLPKEGEAFGWWDDEIPDDFSIDVSGMLPDQPVFCHLIHPKPRLILFGAGPDAKPLAHIAAQTGFSVYVCDWREEHCQRVHFPEAEKLIIGFPSEILVEINFLTTDYVVVMSHHFQRDQEILLNLPINKIRYVGVLGPRERTNRIFLKKAIPKNVYSPAGLTISARGAEEIAVSIMAQLIELWRNSAGNWVKTEWASYQ